MSRLGLVYLVFSRVSGVIMGYVLSVENPALALIAAIALVPASYLARRAAVIKASKRGDVLVDEMHVSITEKAGFQALRASAIVISLILIDVVWPSYIASTWYHARPPRGRIQD